MGTPWEHGYVAMHPRLGDAVIFDQRLSHAGNTHYMPFGGGRLFMQVGFGRSNKFTDEFERGTVQRQQTLQAKMLNASIPRGWLSVLADAKFTLMGGALTLFPPQFLNYYADRDVKEHISRTCTQ